MPLVPIIAWAAAAVLALIVLGFGAAEIRTKTRRLQRDLARLESVRAAADELKGDLDVTRQRIAAARTTATGA